MDKEIEEIDTVRNGYVVTGYKVTIVTSKRDLVLKLKKTYPVATLEVLWTK